MYSSINPFEVAMDKNRENPHAKTLRASFLEKLRLTYLTLVGEWRILDNDLEFTEPHYKMGMLDYCGLALLRGTMLLLGIIYDYNTRSRNKLFNGFRDFFILPLFYITLGLDVLIRYPLGAVLTIALSPIVALVHGVSTLIKAWVRREMKNELKKERDSITQDTLAFDNQEGLPPQENEQQLLMLNTRLHYHLVKEDIFNNLDTDKDIAFQIRCSESTEGEPLKQMTIETENQIPYTADLREISTSRFFKLVRYENARSIGEVFDDVESQWSPYWVYGMRAK